MRVIAGQWRGRKLVAPKGDITRPTADRTRETMFNMLVSRLGSFEGLTVADLFAGSGALGIEALSRGAASCLFVEEERRAVEAIRANLAALGAAGAANVRQGSVMALGPAAQPLDVLLLDPPYRTGAGAVALDRLQRLGWIGPASWVALETAGDEKSEINGLALEAERKVGKARLMLFRAEPATG